MVNNTNKSRLLPGFVALRGQSLRHKPFYPSHPGYKLRCSTKYGHRSCYQLAPTMEEKGSAQKRCKYDATFKEEVLKMVQHGRPMPEIAQSLGSGENLIYKWKSRTKD